VIDKLLIEQIKRHEGLRLKVYRCPAGKLTIGYGRNLEDNGISEEEADYLLINDLHFVEESLARRLAFWENMPKGVQQVLINMGFQLGINGLMAFRRTLALLDAGNYGAAADEMLNSRWAKQTPGRAKELAQIVREQR